MTELEMLMIEMPMCRAIHATWTWNQPETPRKWRVWAESSGGWAIQGIGASLGDAISDWREHLAEFKTPRQEASQETDAPNQ